MSRPLPAVVSVELDAAELGGPIRIGSLRRVSSPTGALVAFAYDDTWVARPDAFVIDPTHGLYRGEQYPRQGTDISPMFTDAAPDRWGRTLLERREALAAREEGRSRRTLGDWEILLGVADTSRMGALRFRDEEGRNLDDTMPPIPPMTRLRELEAAAREIERPSQGGRSTEAHHLALLLAPGSSLGGARPKATYLDQDGALWLAKFPSRADTRDMAACEWVLHELAVAAGISVAEHRLLALGSDHHTFAARRFDRGDGSRRLYASAMTMTRGAIAKPPAIWRSPSPSPIMVRGDRSRPTSPSSSGGSSSTCSPLAATTISATTGSCERRPAGALPPRST